MMVPNLDSVEAFTVGSLTRGLAAILAMCREDTEPSGPSADGTWSRVDAAALP